MNYVARIFASAVIRKLAYLAVAAGIAFASQCVHAAGSTDIGYPSGISFASDGTPFFQVPKPLATPAVSSDVYMATRYAAIPTSKGPVMSAFGYELPVAVSRLGPYVVKLAKGLGPAAMIAMGLDSVLCATADICIVYNLFQKLLIDDPVNGSTSTASSIETDMCGHIYLGHVVHCVDPSTNGGHNLKPGQIFTTGPCAGSWVIDGCAGVTVTRAPYTTTEWSAAETSLSTLDVVPPLIMSNQPIPVGTPTITAPADKTIAETTEVTRDGTGTATGTKTATTTLHIDPPASPTTDPNKVGTSETTIITNYDTSNTVTSTTTTAISSPDAAAPQPDPVDQCKLHPGTVGCMPVGDIPADDIIPSQTKSISFTPFDLPTSSGCPAPIAISLAGHSISISFSWICQYASVFKPLVISAAWLSAAFIVFGGIKEGQGG